MNVEQLQKSAHFRQVHEASTQQNVNRTDGGAGFKKILHDKIAVTDRRVNFSAHAAQRLADRNIVLTDNDLSRLDNAMTRVAEKGGRDSLVVMGDMSFVVSVENRTIITAMQNQNSGQDKIFTNIDSALII